MYNLTFEFLYLWMMCMLIDKHTQRKREMRKLIPPLPPALLSCALSLVSLSSIYSILTLISTHSEIKRGASPFTFSCSTKYSNPVSYIFYRLLLSSLHKSKRDQWQWLRFQRNQECNNQSLEFTGWLDIHNSFSVIVI